MFFRTSVIYLSLFLGCHFIFSGNGLVSVYFPIYAKHSVSNGTIGLITSFYYIGFFVGCLYITKIVHRVGHIRTFTFLCSLIAASALGFSIIPSTFSWIPLRFLMGFGYAGLYVVIESWISSQSSNQERGKVFGIYRVVELSSLCIGQFFLIFIYTKTPHFHFSIVTLLTVLAALPLSLTLLPQPSITEPLRIDLRSIWGTSRYSTITMILVGMANSVIWMLTPLYFLEKGLSENQIPYFFMFYVAGGVFSQYPVGLLSDRLERRSVTLVVSILALGVLVLLHFLQPGWAFKLTYFALGFFSMPIYSLVMTHAMDRSTASETGQLSAQLLLLYSVGAIFGPTLCGFFMKFTGKEGYLYYLGTVFTIMIGYGVYQRLTRPAVDGAQKEPFKLFPESSPAILLHQKSKQFIHK